MYPPQNNRSREKKIYIHYFYPLNLIASFYNLNKYLQKNIKLEGKKFNKVGLFRIEGGKNIAETGSKTIHYTSLPE